MNRGSEWLRIKARAAQLACDRTGIRACLGVSNSKAGALSAAEVAGRADPPDTFYFTPSHIDLEGSMPLESRWPLSKHSCSEERASGTLPCTTQAGLLNPEVMMEVGWIKSRRWTQGLQFILVFFLIPTILLSKIFNCCCCGLVTKSCSNILQPPWTATRLLCPWDSPGKNIGATCHFLLQGVFPTQGQKLCLLHWQVDTLPPRHQKSLLHLTPRERGSIQVPTSSLRLLMGKEAASFSCLFTALISHLVTQQSL